MLFDGIKEVIESFEIYQNSFENITGYLTQAGLQKYFGHIIGYEEVPRTRQKPHPEGLLTCVSALANLTANDLVVYIGDHETDTQSAYFANETLGRKAVINIGVFFSKADSTSDWEFQPDYVISQPRALIELIGDIEKEGI